MAFNVFGTITITIDQDIEAKSKEEALEKIKEELDDFYHLSVHGAPHLIEKTIYDVDIAEYND